jgi:hypothetical protein
MFTDEDMIRELKAGFRDETADMHYTGRVPRLRGSAIPWTVAPIAAAAAAMLVLPQVAGNGTETASPRPGTSAAPLPAGPSASSKVVTDAIQLAGFSFNYEHIAGTPIPEISTVFDATPPDGATPVAVDTPLAQTWATSAWVGVDPASKDAAIWIWSEGKNTHVMFTSPDLTQDDLVAILRS